MSTDLEVLTTVERAFGAITRPEHFTDYQHCEECWEHDETLRAKPREALTREDLGTLGWNPVTFCSLDAKAYLFPRLARELLAEADNTWGWYGPEFISLVYRPLGENEFLQYCTTQQRTAVATLIQHIIETRSELVDSYSCADEILNSYQEWTIQPAVT